ncbi:MAG: hypothetical protein N2037_09485, partial [Acidimicrobiales bacterium]|nr:hypothetical protein [Acidimicrobiales bacterium]
FDALDPLLDVSAAFLEPYLRRHLDDARVIRDTAEWVTRVAISYAFDPNDGVILADPGVARDFVATYFVPGIDAQLGTRPATGTETVPVATVAGDVDLTTPSNPEPSTSFTEPDDRVGTSHKEYLPS